MNPTKLTHEEVLVVDKITYEAKITDFELRNTPTGRQYFWDGENSEKMNIKDGLQFICDAACYGFDFALEFGLTQQEIDTWNAMIDRFGLSDEFKAEDFKEREILRAKESTRKQTMKKLNITKEQFEKSKYFKNKYGKLEYVSESGKVFKTEKGKILMFKESHTDMSAIEDKLAAALDAEIRTMTPDDIQVVSESALDETGVSTIFVLLQNAFQSRKFTDEEKKKILNADPKLTAQMVLDIIDRSLPQSKGALVLALGLARDTVKKMSDTDWKDIVEYALNNPDNL